MSKKMGRTSKNGKPFYVSLFNGEIKTELPSQRAVMAIDQRFKGIKQAGLAITAEIEGNVLASILAEFASSAGRPSAFPNLWGKVFSACTTFVDQIKGLFRFTDPVGYVVAEKITLADKFPNLKNTILADLPAIGLLRISVNWTDILDTLHKHREELPETFQSQYIGLLALTTDDWEALTITDNMLERLPEDDRLDIISQRKDLIETLAS